ncbi:signal recognition particle subunit [Dipsacomyces acuminosporus]|nr:signal recognition particle subunit [Dipsacomyces acuminosporus]
MSDSKGKLADLDVDDMDFPLPDVPMPSSLGAQPAEGIRIGQSFGGMKVVSDAGQFRKWVCLYPLYFDKQRSIEQGRKVPKELAVESPHGRQLSRAVKEVGFNVCYEPHKSHPRDFFTPGRVRVQLFDDQGKPTRSDIQTRKKLMRYVAEKMADIDVPKDQEPTLQDLIDSGAMPALPGLPPPGMSGGANEDQGKADDASPSSAKVSKKSAKANKKKSKAAKNIV